VISWNGIPLQGVEGVAFVEYVESAYCDGFTELTHRYFLQFRKMKLAVRIQRALMRVSYGFVVCIVHLQFNSSQYRPRY
jgi:hypothetical protein